jgi:hypothetical protein
LQKYSGDNYKMPQGRFTSAPKPEDGVGENRV